ncbi:MAG: hypothetical protein HZC28_20675 [Spirochaetes bacterium]|nr:hypothetical protein [Spirochaetota bacterium]
MSDRIKPRLNEIVEQIELFRYDVDVPRHYSWGNWDSRQIGFIRIASGGHSGWGENRITSNDKHVDIVKWASCFAELKGRTITEALDLVADRLKVWGTLRCEMAEMALLDLAGNCGGYRQWTFLISAASTPSPDSIAF